MSLYNQITSTVTVQYRSKARYGTLLYGGLIVPGENWRYMYLVEVHIQQILPFGKRLY